MANKREVTEPQPEKSFYSHGKINRVSHNATIYVQDSELWEKVKTFADEKGISISELVMQSVQQFMDEKVCGRCERIREILSTGSVVKKNKK